MPVTLNPARFNAYCGARSIECSDEGVVRCTICDSRWTYSAAPDWWRCPRGCGDWLDAYPESAKAGRILTATRPQRPALPPTLNAPPLPPLGPDPLAGAAEPRARGAGRPRGSSVTLLQVVEAFGALRERSPRRPTRAEVAQLLHVSADTVDRVLAQAGTRFADLS